MTDSSTESFGKQLQTWVQTIGIIIAAGWAVYTFIYKEIMVPQSAPINITLNLDLEKVSTYSIKKYKSQETLAAVKMTVLAMNPSSRSVELLPSIFMIMGLKLSDTNLNEKDWLKMISDMNEGQYPGKYIARHLWVENASVVAAGEIFDDYILHPNERIRRTIIFHVPLDTYDVLESTVVMGTVKDLKKVKFKWRVDENGFLSQELYRIRSNGEYELVKTDEYRRYADIDIGYLGAVTRSQISLR